MDGLSTNISIQAYVIPGEGKAAGQRRYVVLCWPAKLLLSYLYLTNKLESMQLELLPYLYWL